MIIKGAVLSTQRRLWGRAPAPEPEPEAARRDVAPTPAAVRVETPALSPERVWEWLKGQDLDVRRTLAVKLADELESVRAAARREAWDQGIDAGRREARQESALLLKGMAQLQSAYQQERDEQLKILAASAEEIAVAALARLVGPVAASPEGVVGAVLEVLANCPADGRIRIAVSEGDLAMLQQARERITHELQGVHFDLVADPRVQTGGCLVETDQGIIDGRLETQLERLSALIIEYKRAARGASEGT